MACVLGKMLDGDFIGYLEGELESIRHLTCQLFNISFLWETVETSINAHGLEHL